MAVVNGINGISHTPTTTTLDDLLRDSKFGPNDTQVTNADNNGEKNYQACLAAFIRGNPEECLETMYEYDFLEAQTLFRSERTYALFQCACDAVKKFSSLKASLQTVVREIFTGDTGKLRDHLIGKSRAFEIALLNRYYRCCAKVLQMDSQDHSAEATYLERKMRSDIGHHSFQSLTEDPESVVELQQLVETYIFHIQIALLYKQASSSLYRELSQVVPGLSKNLRRTKNNDKSAEQCILDLLESKQSKSKNTRRGTSPSRACNTEVPMKALPVSEVRNEAATVVASATEHQQQQHVTPGWFRTLHRFISRFEYSRQTLLISFLLLLLSAKKIGKLSRLPEHIMKATRAALPHIQNLLKLLSSI